MCVNVLSFMKEVTVLTILRLLLVAKGRYRQGHYQGHLVKLYLGRIYLGQTCHSNSENSFAQQWKYENLHTCCSCTINVYTIHGDGHIFATAQDISIP